MPSKPLTDIPLSWDVIQHFLVQFGATKGLFVLFFFLAHWYIKRLFNQNIKFKQDEIDRMAQNAKEMREENKSLRDEIRQLYKIKRK